MAVGLIGLAVASRLARDPRTHEAVIVVAIALGALAGLGRASRSRSLARLAAWDKRQNEALVRKARQLKR